MCQEAGGMTRTTPAAVQRSLRQVGEHLRTWRKLRGLTAAEVADRAGLAVTVRHLRRRQATQLAPRPEVLAHLAKGALDGCGRGARHPDRLLTHGLSMTITYNDGFLHFTISDNALRGKPASAFEVIALDVDIDLTYHDITIEVITARPDARRSHGPRTRRDPDARG